MVELEDIRRRTSTVKSYIEMAEATARQIMLEKHRSYNLDMNAVEQLRRVIPGVTCVVFSAAWCKDCKEALPVLLHLEEELGMEIRVFGSIKTAPLNPNRRWAIPPSPPEMESWNVTHIPWLEFFDEHGMRIGTIIEKPQVKETLEEEILYTLTK